jgi:hypothetical protein
MVNSSDFESVKSYFSSKKDEIIRDYKATGAGIGLSDKQDKSYAIVVYLTDKKLVPKNPVLQDGIELKFEVTGPIILHAKGG